MELARNRVFEIADETLEKFYRDVAEPSGKLGDERCFSLLSYRPPSPASRLPIVLGATGMRVFMRYCLDNMETVMARVAMTDESTNPKEWNRGYDLQFQPLGPAPDPTYVAWLVMTRQPTPTTRGEFTVIYDPVKLAQVCNDAWCREKTLFKVVAHECCHALLHTDAYLTAKANSIVRASPKDEVDAHRFSCVVLGDALGIFAEWSSRVWKNDAAWLQ